MLVVMLLGCGKSFGSFCGVVKKRPSEVAFKGLFFYNSTELPKTFSTPRQHHHKHSCQFSRIFHVACIFYGFREENTRKQRSDVTQLAFGVRIRPNLAWGPASVMRTCCQMFVYFHACNHKHHV